MLYHRALEREHEGRPYLELARLRDGLSYCIHPDFLQEQLQECRQRLRHNLLLGVVLQQPELFLQWAIAQGLPRDEAQHELLRRLEYAFAFLEQECQQGYLRSYGIQSECLLPHSASSLLLPFPELVELARSVGGEEHHFRLLLIPFNLFEPQAAIEPVIGGQTLLEYAVGYGIQVVAYRPLNAQLNGRPVLIAEPPVAKTTLVSVEHIRGQLREFVHAETQLLRSLTSLPLNGVQRDMVRESLTLSLFLQDHWHEFASYEDWIRMQSGYLTERLRSLAQLLKPLLTTTGAEQEWQTYRARLQQALSDIGRLYAARAWERARRLRPVLEEALQCPIPPVPLAQLALALIRHTEGIRSILVASSSADHIAENIASHNLSLPPLRRQQWTRLQAARLILEHGF
ncbi:MAG: hypothetical protein NZ949_08120, partial [Candidatus Kapabacteria bacterium]|nr:hypothetical protein [Candidatus Kapabacteria bacterium]